MCRPLTIGVRTPLTRGRYFAKVLSGIHATASEAGAQLIVMQSRPPLFDFQTITNTAAIDLAFYDLASIDAYISVVNGIDRSDAVRLLASGKPLVTIGGANSGLDCPDVSIDNVGSAMAAVDHLISHGHRRIAFAGPLYPDDLKLRHMGYERSLREHGVEPDPELFFLTEDLDYGVVPTARRLIAAGMPCTAIFAATDRNAYALMRALQAAGYRVPEDVAVVGFDDLPIAGHANPPLTTMRQSFEALGPIAVELVLAQFAGKSDIPRRVIVPVALVKRLSCGCPERQSGDEPLMAGQRKGDQYGFDLLVEELSVRLLEVPPDSDGRRRARDLSGLGVIVAALAGAVHDGAPPPITALASAWRSTALASTSVESLHGCLQLLCQAANELGKRLADPQAAKRVRAYVSQAQLHCLRATQFLGALEGDALEESVLMGNKLSDMLVSQSASSILGLGWLKHTDMRIACVACWESIDENIADRHLLVRGVFASDGSVLLALGSRLPLGEFPPAPFLSAARAADGGVVVVIPLRTAAVDWGILAVEGPSQSLLCGGVSEPSIAVSDVAGVLTRALERGGLQSSLDLERRMLQNLFDAMPDHIYFKDRMSRVVRANKAQAAYLGFRDPVEAVGKTDFDLFPRELAQQLFAIEQQVISTGQPSVGAIEDHESVLHHPHWIQSTKVPMLQDGEVIGLIGISRDVTSLKQAEELLARQAAAAEELADLRSGFVAAVSHELRTPLAGILGFAELLQGRWGHLDDEARRTMVSRIVMSANRQQRLVEDLLLLSRIELGGIAVKVESVPLKPLVDRAIEEVRMSYYPSQRVNCKGSDELSVLGDSDRIVEILVNLIDNAAKYSPEGSSVDVSWAYDSRWASIRVRDRGTGVQAEERQRLFTRFGRVPGSRIRAGRVGVGLGLYLSRSFAQAMSGDLSLESSSASGSVFRLTLPLVPSQSE